MKHMLRRGLSLLLCLVMVLPTFTAFATPQNHTQSDVTVAQGITEDFRYPAVVNTGDALLAVFEDDTPNAIYSARSADYGKTWIQSEFAICTGSSPDLFNVGGVLLLTYYNNGVWLRTSTNGGQTWSEEVQLQSQTVTASACTGATGLENGDVLFAMYGKGPQTATGGWHADAVAVRYSFDGSAWTYVSEALITQEADETAIAYTGNNTVWAFTGDSGNVHRSDDNGATWTKVAQEQPRVMQEKNSGVMYGEMIQHPSMVQVGPDRWFVTFTQVNTDANKPWEVQGKIVYGKMFYPAYGWDATYSRPLYSGADVEGLPKGSPVSAPTGDGRLLSVYYDTSVNAIGGTFSKISDWPTPEEESKYIFTEVEFESDASLPAGVTHDSTVKVDGVASAKHDSWREVIAQNRSLNIEGKHSFQFEFLFDEDDAALENKNDLWFRPYNSNACQIKIRVMQDSVGIYQEGGSGVTYGYDAAADTVVAEPVALSERLAADTWYTVRCEKDGRTFRVKVWPKGAIEPKDWLVEGTYDSTTADDKTSGVGYYVRYRGAGVSIDNLMIYKPALMTLNKTYIEGEAGQSGNALQLAANFWPNQEIYTELSGSTVTFTSNDPSVVEVTPVIGSNRAKLTLHKRGAATVTASYGNLKADCTVIVRGESEPVWLLHEQDFAGEDSLPVGVRHDNFVTVDGVASTKYDTWRELISMDRKEGNLYVAGKHSFQFDFLFDEATGNDLWFRPYYSNTCSVKIRVTEETVGINYEASASTGYGYDAGAGDTVIAEPVAFNEKLTSGTWYTVKTEKEGQTFRVKVWARGSEEPLNWTVIGTHNSSTSKDLTTPVGYYVRYRGAGASIDNLKIAKNVRMSMNKTELTGVVGQEGVKLTAQFTPNLMDAATQLPTPAASDITFTSSDPSIVDVVAVDGRADQAELVFKSAGSAKITATLGEISTTSQVYVKPAGTELVTRWDFFKFDFEDWNARPAQKLTKNALVNLTNGMAEMTSGKPYANFELWKGDSPLNITGRFSFQFNFRFNEDDASNAVWFRPYYNSGSSLKVTVTPDKVAFYNGGYGTGCNYPYYAGDASGAGADTLVGEMAFDQGLSADTWYTVRCEKDGQTLRVKVWNTYGEEPEEWLVSINDRFTDDKRDDPVGFFIRYNADTAGQTMSLDDFVMFKEAEMNMPDTVSASLTLPISELEAVFTPDIYKDQPVPPAVTFTCEDETVAALRPIAGAASKTALHFLKEGTTSVTAVMDAYKAKSQINVAADDGKVSATRWEFFKFDFTSWDTRPFPKITKNGYVAVENGEGKMTAGSTYSNIEISRHDSPQGITGKFSFQFDFKFNEEDAANAVWFRPYYNSQSSLKVTVTPDKVALYNGSYGTACNFPYLEGDDVVVGEGALAEPLVAGTWYTVRFEREAQNMRVRVWPKDSAEPDTWNATGTDRYTSGKANDRAGFFIRYNSGTAGNSMAIDNFIMFKDTVLTMKESYTAGLNLPFMEMEAAFVPNIYADEPAPPAVNFYSTDPSTVALQTSEETPTKVTMNFRKPSSEEVNVIAAMEGFFANCAVTVVEDNGQVSANRWDFYQYDFNDAASKPAGMDVGSTATIADGVAKMTPGSKYTDISVYRGNGIKRNGRHSFQFDFCFEADDAGLPYEEQNAVWFRPYYSGRSSTKITITQDTIAMYNEGRSTVEYGYSATDDKIIMAPVAFDERLQAGTWYTVRVEKDARTFRMKVWPRDTEEPAEWIAEGANTATTTDVDDMVNPVGYYIRHRGTGMYLDNLVMYKYATMAMKDTVIGGIKNKNPLQVEASFTPDIYAESPTPPQIKFYISDESLATLDVVATDDTANNKNNMFSKRLSTDADNVTLTAILGDFFGVSKVKVMDIVPEPTTEIGNRLELFVDQDMLDIEDEVDGVSDNVTLVLHEPQAMDEPENPFPRGYYSTVIWDEAYGIYRGYHRVDGSFGQRYCYVESTDGINWNKPSLGIYPMDELYNKLPNVIIGPSEEGNVAAFDHNFSPFLDTSVPVGHPERYKAVAGYGGDLGDDVGKTVGLYTMVSADGIHWTRKSDEPVVVYDAAKHSWAFDSQNVAFWSEAEQQYVCYYRHYVTEAGDIYRTVGRATSKDFITWVDEFADGEGEVKFKTPNLNGGKEQLYTNQTAPYFRAPHIYIGTAARYALGNVIAVNSRTGKLYTESEATSKNLGATDIMLLTSRAGYNHYNRYFEEAFVRPGMDIVSWTDRWNYPSLNVIPTGEKEMSFFNYDGTRFALRIDGFASAHAGTDGGVLMTKPVKFTDKENLALLVNFSTSIRGSLRVELLNQFGEVIPGFERENCVPMTGDSIEKAVVWTSGHTVSELVGKDVKVCFVMNDCDLYSYKFDTSSDAGISKLEATFEQGNRIIYAGSSLDALQSMLTVEAVMNDGTRVEISPNNYTLSGTLKAGNSRVTVYAGEQKTTFRVKATAIMPVSMYAVTRPGEGNYQNEKLHEVLIVTGVNNDGSEFPIYPDAYTLSCSGTSMLYDTVHYKGMSAKIEKFVAEELPEEERHIPFIESTYVKPVEGEQATNISDRLELFVDSTLVESVSGNAAFKQHAPQKAAASRNPFPANAHYTTVIYDQEARLYRGYYRNDDINGYCYAESTDGINWSQPALGLYPQYSQPNVILASASVDPTNVAEFDHNFSPFLDTSVPAGHPERYKAVAGYIPAADYSNGNATEEDGLYTLVSPDGIHWSRKSDTAVIPYNKDLHGQAFDSQNVAFWSEAEQQYVCYFRHYNTQDNMTRTIGRATSKDFVTWVDETAEFVEPNLPGEQLYTTQTAPYFRAPHIYLSTATRFAPGTAIDKTGSDYGATDVMLMSSRAGSLNFERQFTEAFLKAGVDKSGWNDRYNYMSLNMVPTGYSELSLYHFNGDRYTLRTDGFASIHAGAAGGEVVTKPVIFSGEELMLNFSASTTGNIYVELQQPDGTPYPGFEAENCNKVAGDSIEKVVTWKGAKVKDLIGQPVKIRFILKDCDLYSYRFGTSMSSQIIRLRAEFKQDRLVYALGSFEQLPPMLTVYAVYADGTERIIDRDGYGIRGSLAVGNQTITVYHENLMATFSVAVTAVMAKEIKVRFTETVDKPLSYEQIKSKLEVTGVNNDGSTFPIHPDVYSLEVFGSGENQVYIVRYRTLSANITIEAAPTSGPNIGAGNLKPGAGTVVKPSTPAVTPSTPVETKPVEPKPDETKPEAAPEEPKPNTTPTVPEESLQTKETFADVKSGAWYHEAVEYVVAKGLMTGVSDTEFAPASTLNRAMVVTVLWRMENQPKVDYTMTFEDVADGQWYTEAIRWAASNGIVNGIDDKTFAPADAVTREQLVAILWRYAQKKGQNVSVGETTDISGYADAQKISEYARPAMQWACGADVIGGSDGMLSPKAKTKRSEFAQVIMNFCENAAD